MKQYSILGPYNFFDIVEVSDNNAIYRISEELRNQGTVGLMNIQTIATNDLIKTLKEESSLFPSLEFSLETKVKISE